MPRDEERPLDELQREASAVRERLAAIEREIARRALVARPPEPSAAPPTSRPALTPLGASPPPPSPATRMPTGFAADRADAVERFVGSRLIAWLGAFVTLVAVAVFVKFAYDEGWFRGLGPVGRLTLAYVFSAGLIATGQLFARRIARGAEVGFVAAGIGSFYAATVVGTLALHALEGTAGLLVTSGVTLLGLVFTIRSRSFVVGSVSVLGAYLAPVFLSSYRDDTYLLGLHLSVVFGVALALSYLRPRPFRAMRYLAVPLQALFAVPLAAGVGDELLVLVLASGWWCMLALECLLAAWQGLTPRGNVVATTLGTILVATLAVPFIAGRVGWNEPLAFAPLCLAAFAGIGHLIARGPDSVDAYSDEERSIAHAMRLLASAFLVQAVALLVFGVAPFLSELGLALAWSVSAVLLIEVARAMRVPFLRFVAVGLVLMALPVTLFEIGLPRFSSRITHFPSGEGWPRMAGVIYLRPEAWAPLALFASMVWGLVRERRRGTRVGREIIGIGAALAWILFDVVCCDWNVWVIVATLPVFVAARFRIAWLGSGLLTVLAAAGWLVACLVIANERGQGAPIWLMSTIAFLAVGAALFRMGYEQVNATRQVVAFGAATLWIVLAAGFQAFVARWNHVDQAGFVVALDLAAAVIAVVGTLVTLAAASLRVGSAVQAAAGGIGVAAIGWLVGSVTVMLASRRTPQGWFGDDVEAGILLVLALAYSLRQLVRQPGGRREAGADGPIHLMPFPAAIAVLASLAFLWTVSIGIIDWLHSSGSSLVNPALSGWWGIYGIALIIVGFARRRSWLRWSGLAVLGLVFLKVLAVDLSETATIYRVAALLVVGLALVGTSVLYVKLRPPPEQA